MADKSCNAVATIAAKPAAGPETPMDEPEKSYEP
jgi:hypothetical protein